MRSHDPRRGAGGPTPAEPRDPSIALFIAALGLRPAVIGVGPVASQMASGLGMSHLFVSTLEAIPIICMGLFAPLGPFIARRLGDRTAMAIGLALIAIAASLRAVVSSPLAILALTLVVGMATGAAGALPAVVGKLRASYRRATAAAAASATGIVAGATIAAAAAGPAADLLGGWRPSIALMGAICLVPLAGWLVAVPPYPAFVVSQALRPAKVWLLPVTWLLALAYGFQGMVYWGANAWLPSAFLERGWSLSAAGGLVALLNVGTLVGNVSLIWLSRRVQLGRLLVMSGIAILAGTLGLALQVPLGAPATVLLGIGNGMIYPVLLALTITLADDPVMAGSMAAFMLLIGYELSAAGPLVLGFVRDAEGSFAIPMALMALMASCLVGTSIVLAGRTHIERVAPGAVGSAGAVGRPQPPAGGSR